MTPSAFQAITDRIERQLEGGGYSLTFHLFGHAGPLVDWTWAPVEGSPLVIELSQSDRPPLFLALDAVAAVELVS